MSRARELMRRSLLAVTLGAVAAVSTGRPVLAEETAPQTVSLKGCAIRLADGQPLFVQRVVEDLGRVVETCTGQKPEVRQVDKKAPAAEASGKDADRPVIEIGLQSAAELDKGKLLPAAPGPESYAIVARQSGEAAVGRHVAVSVGGADAAGVKFGVVELIRRLRVSKGDVRIELPLYVAGQPRFTTRSMYAHLHWSYNRPYALRSWTLDDWKRYVDLLTHLGFNTIQMWPMMELIPHPMSAADAAYLKKYAALVDYIHEQRGMKAFIGSCPNNITEDARGIPIEKREYFDFEKRLDPSDPAALQRILEYRSDLYRTVPHADGYWMIDSDPGGWKGSPASAFVDILVGHRQLIDKLCQRPTHQPLIYWMWMGWGRGKAEQNFGDVLDGMIERIKGPWLIHVCGEPHVQACEARQLQDRAIYFPYGLIEDEPCGPLTDLRLKRIQDGVKYASDHHLRAIQGNAQTPLAQMPNIVALAIAAWGGDTTSKSDGALRQLADRLVSRDAEVVADAWGSLDREDGAESLRLADRLRQLAGDESAHGTLWVVIGDWQTRILNDLAILLVIHARALAVAREAAGGEVTPPLIGALSEYLIAAARWLEYTGFHNNNAVAHNAYLGPVRQAIGKLRQKLGASKLDQQLIQPALSAAGQKANPQFVDHVAKTLLGKRG